MSDVNSPERKRAILFNYEKKNIALVWRKTNLRIFVCVDGLLFQCFVLYESLEFLFIFNIAGWKIYLQKLYTQSLVVNKRDG